MGITLDEIVARYSNARRGTPADNARLLDFYHKKVMEGKGLQIGYRRDPDFARYLEFIGSENIVLYMVDKRDHVSAVGTFAFRPAFIRDQIETVAYLVDLRVGRDRETLVNWRKIFGDIVKNASSMKEFHFTKYFYAAVLSENTAAQKALVDQKKTGFVYEKLADYDIVNILGKVPTLPFSKRSHGLNYTHLKSDEVPELLNFLESQNKGRMLGFCFKESEWAYRLANWNQFSIQNFVIARNTEKKIVGCVAPWNAGGAKRVVLEQLPPALEWLRKGINLARTSNGLQFPKVGGELSTLFLSHLEIDIQLPNIDRSRIFEGFLNFIYADSFFRANYPWHFICYANYAAAPFHLPKTHFVTQSVPAGLFAVRAADATNSFGGQIPDGFIPGFEIAVH